MSGDHAQQAIKAALTGDWEKARDLNSSIVKDEPDNTDALNRLARAYAELGNLDKARQTAQKSLDLDPFNQIAKNALEKWKDLKVSSKQTKKASSAQVFLEEPGRTKIVKLMNIGSPDVLAQLDAGDEVTLNTHGHLVSVCTDEGTYVGKLSDVLSSHLKNLISHGNEYASYIKSSNSKEVKIIIRETKRAPKLKDIPSFTKEKIDHITIPSNK